MRPARRCLLQSMRFSNCSIFARHGDTCVQHLGTSATLACRGVAGLLGGVAPCLCRRCGVARDAAGVVLSPWCVPLCTGSYPHLPACAAASPPQAPLVLWSRSRINNTRSRSKRHGVRSGADVLVARYAPAVSGMLPSKETLIFSPLIHVVICVIFPSRPSASWRR